MFKLFRRRRDKPSVMYGVFQKLGQAVERGQRRAADYLNRKTARWQHRQMITALIIFCLLFGGSSAFTIWYSLRSASGTIRIESMKVPAHTIIPYDRINDNMSLSSQELNRILRIRHFLDSLRKAKSGSPIYDSLTRHRPGLVDSLAFI
ncbi:MAG TPA: hypothetical protein PKE30_19710, partial [Niabella sp.]|nr:hypothetical protein [Niabella sp.]